jgi:hypothetical protein
VKPPQRDKLLTNGKDTAEKPLTNGKAAAVDTCKSTNKGSQPAEKPKEKDLVRERDKTDRDKDKDKDKEKEKDKEEDEGVRIKGGKKPANRIVSSDESGSSSDSSGNSSP